MKKLILLLLCGTLVLTNSYAQGNGHKKGHHKHGKAVKHSTTHRTVTHTKYVKVKPGKPRYTRPASPGRDYVYIEEDWNWNPNTNSWVWYGNRWVPAPRPQVSVWVPGTWVKVSSGWAWQPGRWR